MRNLILALASLVVFAIAAAGSITPEQKKADCPMQSCPEQSSCGGCQSACK